MTASRVWPVATAFTALFSISGLGFYGLSFFFDFMVRDLGWSRLQVTSGNALAKVVVGPLFGFLAGSVIDRFGPRRLMIAGILIMGAALVGLGGVSTRAGFYFFYFWNALGFLGAGPLPNQVLLSRWFDRRRGRAMGIAYLGIGAGWALAPPLARGLERAYGWRAALQGLGILAIAVALPFILALPELPARALGDPPAGDTARPLPIRGAPFFLLALASLCSIGAVGATSQHLKMFLTLDSGYGQAEAAGVVSLVGMASLVGRPLVGWCADRFPRRRVMLCIYLLVAAALPLLFFARHHAVLVLFAVAFGIAVGGDYMIIPLMAGEIFDVRTLGRILGIILTADGIAEAVMPMLVGYLRDVTGSYTAGFAVLIGLALAGAVAVSRLPSAPVEARAS